MAKINPNLMVDQEWTGTFFMPGQEEAAFAGRLKYSPTDGVRLEYARAAQFSTPAKEADLLHGHTSTGMPLTLIGEFSSRGAGYSFHNGMHYWTSSGHPFRYAIFGHHFEESDAFESFEFELTGAQEFFCPEGQKSQIPHSTTEVVNAKCGPGEFKVIHSSRFEFVHGDLRTYFHSEDSAALTELQHAYEDIRGRHPNFHPFLKKELDFIFRFVPSTNLGVREAYSSIHDVADLFALLAFEPVRLTRLAAMVRDQEGHQHHMPVFPSSLDDRTTIERSLAKRDYHSLPLNNSAVSLELLIPKWKDKCKNYSSTTSMLQSMTNIVSTHETHGSIVLCATQLEDIAVEAGFTSRRDKYSYGVSTFASPKLREKLASLLECKEDEIGQSYSSLRGEIAHVRKARRYLNRLGSKRVYLVSRAMQLVVIGYILEQIGVSEKGREQYQDRLLPTLW